MPPYLGELRHGRPAIWEGWDGAADVVKHNAAHHTMSLCLSLPLSLVIIETSRRSRRSLASAADHRPSTSMCPMYRYCLTVKNVGKGCGGEISDMMRI